jgi:hypothetical protein
MRFKTFGSARLTNGTLLVLLKTVQFVVASQSHCFWFFFKKNNHSSIRLNLGILEFFVFRFTVINFPFRINRFVPENGQAAFRSLTHLRGTSPTEQ